MKSMIFGFCGIDLKYFQIFDKMRTKNDQDRKDILIKVKQEAKN
jgi:hypothetical protein